MATVLGYTSPALGHMSPMSALLCELQRRGHEIHLRTLSTAVGCARNYGFHAQPIDPRIEAIAIDDWRSRTRSGALKRGVGAFGKRAVHEVPDLSGAIEACRPDFLLIDINCWGGLAQAESAGLPWASFAPYVPPLRAVGLPPFGPGLRPRAGLAGRVRDAALNATLTRSVENVVLPPISAIRDRLGLPALTTVDAVLRRAPLMLIASGMPFQYPGTEWGEGVHLIGPCIQQPDSTPQPDWLAAISRPIVLVTTSSEKQADEELVSTAAAALADEPVHVVATMPSGIPPSIASSSHVTIAEFLPHGMVLDRAVCAITHGGMGATQKALARGVPVCVVPYGRDQFEVARRVEVARCGTRLPAPKLTSARLKAKVHQAMGMTSGARRVADGFEATGGVAHGADLIEAAI